MKGKHQVATFLVKVARCRGPRESRCSASDLLEEFLGQDILGVGVAFLFFTAQSSTFFIHGCGTSGL